MSDSSDGDAAVRIPMPPRLAEQVAEIRADIQRIEDGDIRVDDLSSLSTSSFTTYTVFEHRVAEVIFGIEKLTGFRNEETIAFARQMVLQGADPFVTKLRLDEKTSLQLRNIIGAVVNVNHPGSPDEHEAFVSGLIAQLNDFVSGAQANSPFVDPVGGWEAALKPELPPTVGVIVNSERRLFYDEAFNLLWGSPETGKSFIKCSVIADCLRAGRPVLDIDLEEPTSRRTTRRLRDNFAVTEADYVAGFHAAITRTLTPVTLVPILAAARRLADEGNPPLVAIDSAAKALLGFKARNGNEEAAWGEFYAAMQQFTAIGCCVLTLDHQSDKTPHKDDSTGTYRKRADVDGISLKVETGRPFSRAKDGFSTITVKKDRGGFLDHEAYAIFRGGPGGFCLEPPGSIADMIQLLPIQRRISLVLKVVCAWPGELTTGNLVNGDEFPQPIIVDGERHERMITGPVTKDAIEWLLDAGKAGPLLERSADRHRRLSPTRAGLNRQHSSPSAIDVGNHAWASPND